MRGYDFDIGVIGGGAAGLTIVSGSAQLGAKTLLIEKEKQLGGDCLHFGCVPSKTLIKSAHLYHQMKNAPGYGLPALDLPPVDFQMLSARIRSVIEAIQKHDSEERFCRLGAKVEFGHPHFADEKTVQLNGKTISAKTWVLATGSSPAIPPIPGLTETPYLTNREIFYLDHLPRSMIVLGGGPIGIEMSQAFRRLGTQVTVVQRADQILVKEDKDLADEVMNALKREGVQFYLEAAIQSVKDLGAEKEVVVTDKSGISFRLKAETLLVAAGRSANVEGLELDSIGVEYDPGGIKVDHRLRTSQKHIFAAGDCNGGFQFTHAAGYEGSIVVSNAVFRLPRKADYTYMPWCTYCDPELASIGMNERSAKAAGIEYSVWTEYFRDNDRSLCEGESAGRIKMIVNEKEKPIGVQILGPRAGDLISEWVAILNGGIKLSSLASAVHPYPTIAEINKKVAAAFFSPKIFSDRVRKGLKLFFNLKGRACSQEG